MPKYTERQLETICIELSNAIPNNVPCGVQYDGVSPNKSEVHIRINWPRWYRHPDEYGGDENSELYKRITTIRSWEDKLWAAIDVIEKKYGLTVDMSS